MSTDYKPIKEGKVREIYDIGDALILVATDRISCFDVILNNKVTKKGAVLTQMSKFWFDMTEDIIQNHMISTDVNDMPEFFRKPEFTGNSMMSSMASRSAFSHLLYVVRADMDMSLVLRQVRMSSMEIM